MTQIPSWFTPVHVTGVRSGDNIYAIGAACAKALLQLGYGRDVISAIHKEATSGNYDHALSVYGRYISIESEE